MKNLLIQYRDALTYRYAKSFSNSGQHIHTNNDFVGEIIHGIENDLYSEDQLLLIKDWICCMLHTAGDREFKNISPWVSASQGETRYKVAYLFGQGRKNSTKNHCRKIVNKRFVILDTWVGVGEEHDTFETTEYLIRSLRDLHLPWYEDTYHEIMLKYAIYPHRLIGYYYFENDELQYYFLNPHYYEKWKENREFQIGDYIYINQESVSFPANNPYRIIYSRIGNRFEIFDKR